MRVQNNKYESESVVRRTASEGSISKKTTYSNPHYCLVIIDQDNAKAHRCCHPIIRKLHNPTAPTNIRRQSPDRSVSFDTPPMVKARSRWGNSSALADSMTARSSPKVIQRRHRQQQQQQQELSRLLSSWDKKVTIKSASATTTLNHSFSVDKSLEKLFNHVQQQQQRRQQQDSVDKSLEKLFNHVKLQQQQQQQRSFNNNKGHSTTTKVIQQRHRQQQQQQLCRLPSSWDKKVTINRPNMRHKESLYSSVQFINSGFEILYYA
jgi:DNA polymerase III alpha subunit (gram-positive type)